MMTDRYSHAPYEAEAAEHVYGRRPARVDSFFEIADAMADAARYIARLERELVQERASRRWHEDRTNEGLRAAQEQSGLMFKAVLAGMVVGGRNGEAVADAAELLMPAVSAESAD
jgi:hypothetical protein